MTRRASWGRVLILDLLNDGRRGESGWCNKNVPVRTYSSIVTYALRSSYLRLFYVDRLDAAPHLTPTRSNWGSSAMADQWLF